MMPHNNNSRQVIKKMFPIICPVRSPVHSASQSASPANHRHGVEEEADEGDPEEDSRDPTCAAGPSIGGVNDVVTATTRMVIRRMGRVPLLRLIMGTLFATRSTRRWKARRRRRAGRDGAVRCGVARSTFAWREEILRRDRLRLVSAAAGDDGLGGVPVRLVHGQVGVSEPLAHRKDSMGVRGEKVSGAALVELSLSDDLETAQRGNRKTDEVEQENEGEVWGTSIGGRLQIGDEQLQAAGALEITAPRAEHQPVDRVEHRRPCWSFFPRRDCAVDGNDHESCGREHRSLKRGRRADGARMMAAVWQVVTILMHFFWKQRRWGTADSRPGELRDRGRKQAALSLLAKREIRR